MKQLLIVIGIIVMLSFIPDHNRYFYVTYYAKGEQSVDQIKQVESYGWFTWKEDCYPTLKELEKQAVKQSNFHADRCLITNIIELSATDFKTFSK